MVAQGIASVNGAVNGFVWGPIMCTVFVCVGIYICIRTHFFQVGHFKLWWHNTFASIFRDKSVRTTSDAKSVSQFQALTTALAATIGTGNIVGVATAIMSGGPGAVFWMWISAFFGMMTKYAEIALAMKYREKDANGDWLGGPMVSIKKGMGIKWLGGLFALFTVLASFGIGSGVQANSVASSLNSTFGVPMVVTGICLAIVTALVIIGGLKRIAGVTEKIVPFMAILYIVGGIILIIMNHGGLPDAFGNIFAGAFRVRAIGGGVLGYAMSQAMRYGVARGVFSNEAGLGSSALVHSASDQKEPARQAMWGCFEVFADTIIVCTITALAILSSGIYKVTENKGAALTIEAFHNGFGAGAGIFVSIAIVLFALSTIIGWSYYGERCFNFLAGTGKAIVYKCIFIFTVILGCVASVDLIWDISDTLNGLMAIPNIIGLIVMAGTVAKITFDYVKRREKKDLANEPEEA